MRKKPIAGAGEPSPHPRNDNATTGNRGEVGKAQQQDDVDYSPSPVDPLIGWHQLGSAVKLRGKGARNAKRAAAARKRGVPCK